MIVSVQLSWPAGEEMLVAAVEMPTEVALGKQGMGNPEMAGGEQALGRWCCGCFELWPNN